MVTIQEIRDQRTAIEASLVGDRGTSARQKRDAIRSLERAERSLSRGGSSSAADRIVKDISKKAIFGGRRAVARGTPTGLSSSAIKKSIFVREGSSARFTRNTGGFTPVLVETQRRSVRTKEKSEDDKLRGSTSGRIFLANKRKLAAKTKLESSESKSIIDAQKRIARLAVREQKFAKKFERELSKSKEKGKSRAEFSLRFDPLSRSKVFRKAAQTSSNLVTFAENQFINTKGFGANLSNIGDRVLASKTVIAAAAIDSIKKGEGKKFLKKTFKDLKSQNKSSRKAAALGVVAAVKDPSTYFFALLGAGAKPPKAFQRSTFDSILRSKKAQGRLKGGKTITKLTPNKNVRIKVRKIRGGKENIGEFVIERRVGKGKFKESSSQQFAIIKGVAKSLKGEFGRKPTPGQRSIRGKSDVGVRAFAQVKGSGKVEFLTGQGIVKISKVNKPFAKILGKQVSKLQKTINQKQGSSPSTKLLVKQLKITKEFQKISNRIAKNKASKSDFSRFDVLQRKPEVQSLLKVSKGSPPQAQIVGQRGINTQGRGKVLARLKQSLKSKARQSRKSKLKQSLGDRRFQTEQIVKRILRRTKLKKSVKTSLQDTKAVDSRLSSRQSSRLQSKVKQKQAQKSQVKQMQKTISSFKVPISRVAQMQKLGLALALASKSLFAVKVTPTGLVKVSSLSKEIPTKQLEAVLVAELEAEQILDKKLVLEQLTIQKEIVKEKEKRRKLPITKTVRLPTKKPLKQPPKKPLKAAKPLPKKPVKKPPKPTQKKKPLKIVPKPKEKKPESKRKKSRKQKGFIGQARGRGTKLSKGKFKKGRFISVGKSTTKNRALRQAGNVANHTVSQTIRTVGGKMIKKKTDINKPRVLSLFGKPNSKGERRELPKARINTRGEKQGITVKGLLARRRKAKKKVPNSKKSTSKKKPKNKKKSFAGGFFG